MAPNDNVFNGSINTRLTCLAVFVIALLVTLPGPSQAAINDNEAQQIDGKIVNQGNGSEQANSPRSSILDNIFNIPIQTLKAVNDLVQSIAGNLQAAGSGSYFRGNKNELTRNINVNIDDDGKDKKTNNERVNAVKWVSY